MGGKDAEVYTFLLPYLFLPLQQPVAVETICFSKPLSMQLNNSASFNSLINCPVSDNLSRALSTSGNLQFPAGIHEPLQHDKLFVLHPSVTESLHVS